MKHSRTKALDERAKRGELVTAIESAQAIRDDLREEGALYFDVSGSGATIVFTAKESEAAGNS